MKLTKENIEEQILLLVDGELDQADAAAVKAYVAQHTEYRLLMEAYLATQSFPDDTVYFPGKESLLKEEPQVMPLKKTLPLRLRWAAAVAVVLGIGMVAALVLQRGAETGEQPHLAIERIGVEKHTPGRQATSVAKGHVVVAALPQNEVRKTQGKTPSVQKTVPQKQNAIAGVPPAPGPERERESITPLPVVAEEAITALEIKPVQAITLNRSTSSPAVAAQSKPPGWSPLKEENLQGLNELVAHIQEIKESVQKKTQLLKNATFVLRIGDKEVALGK